ncbi:MAG TPA: hypothetical protein VF473_05680, partial [Cyclobacteriaceae bacterium]
VSLPRRMAGLPFFIKALKRSKDLLPGIFYFYRAKRDPRYQRRWARPPDNCVDGTIRQRRTGE